MTPADTIAAIRAGEAVTQAALHALCDEYEQLAAFKADREAKIRKAARKGGRKGQRTRAQTEAARRNIQQYNKAQAAALMED